MYKDIYIHIMIVLEAYMDPWRPLPPECNKDQARGYLTETNKHFCFAVGHLDIYVVGASTPNGKLNMLMLAIKENNQRSKN